MLSSFKHPGKDDYKNFFNKVLATNHGLTDDPGSRPDWIMKKVRAAHPKTILEIGSQTGGITKFLLQVTHNVTCIDIVPAQLEIVKAMGARTQECFAEDLHTLNIGKFDVVVMTEVLNHIIDAEAGAANAWAKVAKGGHLVVTVPYGDRWVDEITARRFDSDEDLAKLLRTATGQTVTIERLEGGGVLYFYACDIQKP
jgi:2-polyprenyl-3-methyl-5-hydroxy-6-metoxy-1,4-benzoquinol methylase